jgi:hypothetical protein
VLNSGVSAILCKIARVGRVEAGAVGVHARRLDLEKP